MFSVRRFTIQFKIIETDYQLRSSYNKITHSNNMVSYSSTPLNIVAKPLVLISLMNERFFLKATNSLKRILRNSRKIEMIKYENEF